MKLCMGVVSWSPARTQLLGKKLFLSLLVLVLRVLKHLLEGRRETVGGR